MSSAGWQSLELWAKQRAGRPVRQRAGVAAWALALEGAAASLVTAADFELTAAGALVLAGSSGQQASIAILNDDGFLMAVRTGVPPALDVTRSEDRVGLHGFVVEVRSRQAARQANGNAGLDVMGWVSLAHWARRRAQLIASRSASAETRALAYRCARARHGTELPPPAESRKGKRRPGTTQAEDMACAAPHGRSDASHGGG